MEETPVIPTPKVKKPRPERQMRSAKMEAAWIRYFVAGGCRSAVEASRKAGARSPNHHSIRCLHNPRIMELVKERAAKRAAKRPTLPAPEIIPISTVEATPEELRLGVADMFRTVTLQPKDRLACAKMLGDWLGMEAMKPKEIEELFKNRSREELLFFYEKGYFSDSAERKPSRTN